LTVNADGTVRSARVAEGPEPFAAAAAAAASSFVFAPAMRNGTPVAAKIRAEVRFTAPAPAPEALPAHVETSAAPPRMPAREAAPPAPKPLVVVVRGELPAPDVTSLTRAEVRLLPGAFGDPFRALETLPGVTPIFSGLPFFYVRGAPPGNVGYFLDGIRVPVLYHLGLGPSVVNPALVERVDLYPGGYPARYGQYAGGIVAGETKPPLPEWHGEGVLRLVDAGALVEGPFDGGRGAALVGGRYSYTGALLSLAAPDTTLAYWDYQARIGYDLTPSDRVSVFAFGSHDLFAFKDEYSGETTTAFNSTFHRVDLRYDHAYGAGSRVRGAATLGYELTEIEDGQVFDRSLGARLEVDHRLADGTPVRAGIHATLDDNGLGVNDRTPPDNGFDDPGAPDDPGPPEGGERDELSAFLSDRLDLAVGAYAEVDLDITPRFRVTPGLRLDLFDSGGTVALGVDPRLAARLDVTRDVRLVQAHGVASQLPSFVVPIPGVRPQLRDGLQRSFQSSMGVEVELPEDVSAKATVFHNVFFNMTDVFGTSGVQGTKDLLGLRALGSSVGVELSAHRRLTRRLGGFVAYTLSRSTRRFGATSAVAMSDRTHVLNAATAYDFGGGYKAGARVSFYTGVMQGKRNTTPPAPDESYDDESIDLGGPTHFERIPPYFRLDVRVEKRWQLGRTGWLSVVFEALNATLNKEFLPTSCDNYSSCEPYEVGPVSIPSLGLEGGF
jgi:hypothetical protein